MTANRFNFRLWDKKNSRMWGCSDGEYYEYYINLRGDVLSTEEYLAYDYYTIAKDDNSEDEFVLMQSTGLVDKNGKEIYEGDIALISKTDENKIISYSVDYGMLFYKNIEDGSCYATLSKTSSDKIEIIGNIYENKELLGE